MIRWILDQWVQRTKGACSTPRHEYMSKFDSRYLMFFCEIGALEPTSTADTRCCEMSALLNLASIHGAIGVWNMVTVSPLGLRKLSSGLIDTRDAFRACTTKCENSRAGPVDCGDEFSLLLVNCFNPGHGIKLIKALNANWTLSSLEIEFICRGGRKEE